jgi:uncharacterized protein YdiU (UPF0061 family)
LARKRKETKNHGKGTELDVFKDRAGRANLAIFEVLAKTSPQNIKQILKQISRYKGLEETYYASLTKRLHALQETGYVRVAKPYQEGAKSPANYELRMKAYPAMFLKEYSIQEILDKATDTQAAIILLALLNVVMSKDDS